MSAIRHASSPPPPGRVAAPPQPTSTGQVLPAPAQQDLSATLTDLDGTIVTTISRHTEASDGTADAPLTVVRVTGEVDLDAVALLKSVLTGAVACNSRVCCDLSAVDFLSAAGLNAMLAVHRHATAQGRSFHVRGARGITRRVLEITRLDRILMG